MQTYCDAESRGCAVGKDEVLSLPLPGFCLEAQTGLWQLRKPPFLLLQSLLGGATVGPSNLKRAARAKGDKGPSVFLFSCISFPSLA